MIGRTDTQAVPASIAREFRDKELEVVRQQEAIESIEHITLSNGEKHALRSIRFPLMGEDGLIYGVCTQSNPLGES